MDLRRRDGSDLVGPAPQGHRAAGPRRVVGLEDPDFPGSATVYQQLTHLPANSLPDAFIHPAGLCQNVLATGRTWISATALVADREALVVTCDHPRTIGIAADRPDHEIQV